MDSELEKVRWDELEVGDTFLIDDQRTGISEIRVLEVTPRGDDVTEIRAVALGDMVESNLVSINTDLYCRVNHSGGRKLHC